MRPSDLDALPPRSCATCGEALNPHAWVQPDGTLSEVTWLHGRVNPDHDPVPVRAAAKVVVCDFCSVRMSEDEATDFDAGRQELDVLGEGEGGSFHETLGFAPIWAACVECAALVRADDRGGLARRSMRSMTVLGATEEMAALAVTTVHSAFWAGYRP
jgi:hypothetical protein